MMTKERLHQLLDEIPERDWPAVERFLRSLAAAEDPVLRALLDAPVDDEPVTNDDRAAIAEG